jgi:hypothetical protein
MGMWFSEEARRRTRLIACHTKGIVVLGFHDSLDDGLDRERQRIYYDASELETGKLRSSLGNYHGYIDMPELNLDGQPKSARLQFLWLIKAEIEKPDIFTYPSTAIALKTKHCRIEDLTRTLDGRLLDAYVDLCRTRYAKDIPYLKLSARI